MIQRIDSFTTPPGHAATHESVGDGELEIRAKIVCDCGFEEECEGFDASAIALAAYEEHVERVRKGTVE